MLKHKSTGCLCNFQLAIVNGDAAAGLFVNHYNKNPHAVVNPTPKRRTLKPEDVFYCGILAFGSGSAEVQLIERILIVKTKQGAKYKKAFYR